MQCQPKGIPIPNISWRTKVIDIYDIAYTNDITRFALEYGENVPVRKIERGRLEKEGLEAK